MNNYAISNVLFILLNKDIHVDITTTNYVTCSRQIYPLPLLSVFQQNQMRNTLARLLFFKYQPYQKYISRLQNNCVTPVLKRTYP